MLLDCWVNLGRARLGWVRLSLFRCSRGRSIASFFVVFTVHASLLCSPQSNRSSRRTQTVRLPPLPCGAHSCVRWARWGWCCHAVPVRVTTSSVSTPPSTYRWTNANPPGPAPFVIRALCTTVWWLTGELLRCAWSAGVVVVVCMRDTLIKELFNVKVSYT